MLAHSLAAKPAMRDDAHARARRTVAAAAGGIAILAATAFAGARMLGSVSPHGSVAVVIASPAAIRANDLTLKDGRAGTHHAVPKHVITQAYLGAGHANYAPPIGGSFAAYAPYLTWAVIQGDTAGPSTAQAVGIKVEHYTDPPNQQQRGDDVWRNTDASATDIRMDCSGHRISTHVYGGMWQMDLSSAHYQHAVVANLRQRARAYRAGKMDGIFLDDYDFPQTMGYSASAFSGFPCLRGVRLSDAQWLSQGVALGKIVAAAFPKTPIIVNALSAQNENRTAPSPALAGYLAAPDTPFAGAMFESWLGEFDDSPHAEDTGAHWVGELNTMLQVVARYHKTFVALVTDPDDPSSQRAIRDRLYAYATFLLGYDLATSRYWTSYTTPSHFTVMPETQLVALNPLIATPTDARGLLRPEGVYAREYAACYLAGKGVGPCAAVVNSDADASHPFPILSRSYRHTFVLLGSGVLDGGTVRTTGDAPPTSMPPRSGTVVFP